MAQTELSRRQLLKETFPQLGVAGITLIHGSGEPDLSPLDCEQEPQAGIEYLNAQETLNDVLFVNTTFPPGFSDKEQVALSLASAAHEVVAQQTITPEIPVGSVQVVSEQEYQQYADIAYGQLAYEFTGPIFMRDSEGIPEPKNRNFPWYSAVIASPTGEVYVNYAERSDPWRDQPLPGAQLSLAVLTAGSLIQASAQPEHTPFDPSSTMHIEHMWAGQMFGKNRGGPAAVTGFAQTISYHKADKMFEEAYIRSSETSERTFDYENAPRYILPEAMDYRRLATIAILSRLNMTGDEAYNAIYSQSGQDFVEFMNAAYKKQYPDGDANGGFQLMETVDIINTHSRTSWFQYGWARLTIDAIAPGKPLNLPMPELHPISTMHDRPHAHRRRFGSETGLL